ncbi:MAG: hypothetical protein IPP74_14375 [Alphaproteobacteria bacterium]|nr:hypothetical protein [Alphaproteobacteria bacterium]
MPNSSATGGYLLPTNTALDNNLLKRFLHGVIAGVTGLDNTLVRPAYQQNSPPITDIDVDWCAFLIRNRRTEAMPWLTQGDSDATLGTNELFDCFVSFYGPNSSGYAAILRDGLQIPQNSDQLNAAGMAVLGSEPLQYLPELVNDRWYERTDITINLNRNLSRTYDILSLLGATGTMYFDDVATEDFNVST